LSALANRAVGNFHLQRNERWRGACREARKRLIAAHSERKGTGKK